MALRLNDRCAFDDALANKFKSIFLADMLWLTWTPYNRQVAPKSSFECYSPAPAQCLCVEP